MKTHRKISGEKKHMLTESQIMKIVNESVTKVLKEYEEPDFYYFEDALEHAGWAYSGFEDVVLRDGRNATRYNLVKNSKYAINYDVLMDDFKNMFGDNIIFSTATHRYAPELTRHVCYLVN